MAISTVEGLSTSSAAVRDLCPHLMHLLNDADMLPNLECVKHENEPFPNEESYWLAQELRFILRGLEYAAGEDLRTSLVGRTMTLTSRWKSCSSSNMSG